MYSGKKDTVISPGCEFRYRKHLERLLGKTYNWLNLKSMIDEGLRYTIHNSGVYTENIRRTYLQTALALVKNKSAQRPKENA